MLSSEPQMLKIQGSVPCLVSHYVLVFMPFLLYVCKLFSNQRSVLHIKVSQLCTSADQTVHLDVSIL